MRFIAQFSSNAELKAFRVAELHAVADMLGIPLHLTDTDPSSTLSSSDSSSASSLYFSFGSVTVPSGTASHPQHQQLLRDVAARCVLLEELFIPVVSATSIESAAAQFNALPPFVFSDEEEATMAPRDRTFSVRVESYEKKYTPSEKVAIMQTFDFGSLHPGRVNLQAAQDRFIIFLEHQKIETPVGNAPGLPASGSLQRVLVCRAFGAYSGRKALLETYSLKHRPYIGTTSMPPELTFLMCNLAKVQRGDFVMDPFCGTGSTLVTAGHWGAMTLGTDMDGRVLRSGTAKTLSKQQQQQVDLAMQKYDPSSYKLSAAEIERPSMETNFKIYRTPVPGDPVRLNFSNWRKGWRCCVGAEGVDDVPFRGWLDAIVCDPPYGIREQKRRVIIDQHATDPEGSEPRTVSQKEESNADDCMSVRQSTPLVHRLAASASSEKYDISGMIGDLVQFASESLVLQGRLVFWLPTSATTFTDDEIPQHPLLKLLVNLPQNISLKVSRRLVVMEKVRESLTSSEREALAKTGGRCMPTKATDDVRLLMDVTDVPENADYKHYRDKVERKREATRHFLESRKTSDAAAGTQLGPEGLGGETEWDGHKKRNRHELHDLAVHNRAIKLEKQRLRHLESVRQQRAGASNQNNNGDDADLVPESTCGKESAV